MTSNVFNIFLLIAGFVAGAISLVALAGTVFGAVVQHHKLLEMPDRLAVLLIASAVSAGCLFGMTVALTVVGIISGICFAGAVIGLIDGFCRQKCSLRSMSKRLLATGLLGVMLITSLAGCNGGALQGLFSGDNTAAEGDVAVDLAASNQEFAENAFVVDLDEAGMQAFRETIFGPGITVSELKTRYDASLDPYYAQQRIDAVKEGCRVWSGNPDHPGFENPVWKPAMSILSLGRQGWEALSTAEKEAKLDVVKRAIFQEIHYSPAYADMWVQWLFTFDEAYNGIIGSRCPRAVEFRQKLKEYYADEHGIALWFDQKDNELAPNLLSDEYLDFATVVCALLDGNFDWASDLGCAGNYVSLCYWNLPVTVDSNHTRTVRIDDPNEQDNKLTFLLSHCLKSGTRAMLGGANGIDLSAAIYDPNTQKPQPEPEPITPVVQRVPNVIYQPKPTPVDPTPIIPTPVEPEPEQPQDNTPKSAQLVVRYREKGTDKKMSDIAGSAYADVRRNVVINQSYNVQSPKAPQGYKGPDISVVSGKMTSQGALYTVYYEKTGQIPVTVEYRERNYQEHELASSKVIGYYSPGETVTTKPIKIDGYEPTQSEFSVIVQPNKDGATIICWYDGIVTVRYWWWDRHEQAAPTVHQPKELGKWFTIPADVSHDGYEPSPDPVHKIKQSGPMEFDVIYYPIEEPGPKPDGKGGKDKSESNGNKNPSHPNGDLNPDDGTGKYQPTDPGANDRNPSDNRGNAGTAGSDDRQEVNNTPKNPTDSKESSGTGGQDHPISGGDHTFGGTPPKKDEIHADNTTVTTGGSSGSSSNPADHNSSNGNSASTVVGPPPMDD